MQISDARENHHRKSKQVIFSFRLNLWKLLKAFICNAFLFSKSPSQGIPNLALRSLLEGRNIGVLTAIEIPCSMKLLTQLLPLSISSCV